MKVLYSVLLGVLVVIVAISFVLKGESTHFYGVAESMEIVVNSENPVEIKKIHVVQGQAISRGDTLIELISPELDIKISAAQAELGKLKTEQATRIAQLRAERQQLKAQYELN